MKLKTERAMLADYGRKLVEERLTVGTGGNLSCFDRSQGLIAMTPSGLDYFKTGVEDIVILDAQGQVIEQAAGQQPTSEWELHLEIYRRRPDVSAIVHTHSLYATAIACTRQGLKPVHYLLAAAGSEVRCAPYAPYGTPQLAALCAQTLGGDHAVLLANHGVVCVAGDLDSAFSRARHVEYVAQLQCITQGLGGAVLLDQAQMQAVMERFQTSPYR